jgi:uncharacterized repeat protein (TIGR03803 family)
VTSPETRAWFVRLVGPIAVLALGAGFADAQIPVPESVLHTFVSGEGVPAGNLLQATNGTFYGTTLHGGPGNFGTIFQLTADGTFSVLYTFTGGADGGEPRSALVQGADANLYGTTSFGGALAYPSGYGTIFRIDGAGHLAVLHTFTGGMDGAMPSALVLASDGAFYGTTYGGGSADRGTVFKLDPQGTFTSLHSFTGGFGGAGTDGAHPRAPLIQATDGNFYGTTSGTVGGGFGAIDSAIFRMTPDGSVTVVHQFGGAEGTSPGAAALLQGADGNFYGTTTLGGASGHGAVFRMTGGGLVTALHSFGIGIGLSRIPSDGSAIIQATDGSLYGAEDAYDRAAYRIAPDGSYTTLQSLAGGAVVARCVIQATDGNLYGTADTIFQLRLTPTNVSLTADFDGDGKGDLVVYRPATGEWFVRYSSSQYSYANAATFQWGLPGDEPVVADFDGDHKSDLAVYRPTTGTWYIRFSSSQYSYATWTSYQWGLPGDVPLGADLDGDGKADLVVYRPRDGTWYVRFSSSNYGYANWTALQWGLPGDTPLVADVDGDGKSDLVVYRPATGEWFVRYSSSQYSYANAATFQWGLPGDEPVVADFDGDHKSDLAVYRPTTGTWYVRFSSSQYSYATWTSYQWGISGDVPLGADLDGDGKTDLFVYRPSDGTWYIRFSSSNYSYANWTAFQWGVAGDLPL